jgi:hypothetical protein
LIPNQHPTLRQFAQEGQYRTGDICFAAPPADNKRNPLSWQRWQASQIPQLQRRFRWARLGSRAFARLPCPRQPDGTVAAIGIPQLETMNVPISRKLIGE